MAELEVEKRSRIKAREAGGVHLEGAVREVQADLGLAPEREVSR